METAPLKSFAAWARTAVIREVTARISVVLASQELRQEQPKAVAALENAVNVAGGGNNGRDTVADKVAYTWFNRIIALRFMDANGYTGIGVVSPERGRKGGQPEVLAEAKRGNIDSTVVTNKRTVETITSLLNGTRRSDDPQGEAYALLLAEYCRYWNRSMPFMFEPEGDYTELLIPANLLADDSVLAQTVAVLTQEVCKDVEVIGWLYQFYISERKGEVFAAFQKNKKAGAAEIPAATQLFTPHWIVRYLVENSLGRLWLLNRPTSRLADQMDYYIAPTDNETDYLKVSSPEELRVIDPACGSGHMLTYAFDLLYAIYEEEGYAPSDIPALILANNLYGTEIDPRAGALAAFALTMKARARQRTFFSKQVEPNVCVLEPISFTSDELDILVTGGGDRHDEETFWNQFQYADTFGSLIQPDEELIAHLGHHLDASEQEETDLIGGQLFERARRAFVQAVYLSSRYHVVVANPPYMGSGNMGAQLAEYADRYFRRSSSGLDAMFIERALDLVVEGGAAAMVTMHSWMFLSSYEGMRRNVLRVGRISTLIHLGSGVFDSFGGEVVSVAASVILREAASMKHGTFLRLTDLEPDNLVDEFVVAAQNTGHFRRFVRSSADFDAVRGAPIVYFASEGVARFLERKPLSEFVLAGVGTQTGANARFVRFWFEVSSSKLNLAGRPGMERPWTLSTKGGEFRRWYNPTLHVMDWRGGGDYMKSQSQGAYVRNAALYFQDNLVWTKVGSRIPSFRFSDERVVHNDASCFIVSKGVSLDAISSYLNSRSIASLMKEINPTLNLTPGTFLSFPFVEISPDHGRVCRQISQRDWDKQELSVDYRTNELVGERTSHSLADAVAAVTGTRAEEVRALSIAENAIEVEVAAAVGLSEAVDIPATEHSLTANPTYRYGAGKTTDEYTSLETSDLIRDLVSYGVGCMFGRYSLDEPGIILANQGDTLRDYLGKVPDPTFKPDSDNVIPIVDGDWFEDDIGARFRQFLRVSFGEEHFEENLRFVTESLGVKDLRDYFVKSFYRDHVQRYKKRPIYWLFSSPKGSFNALIYMHRYTPSTVSTVLNEYLREFKAKLAASREHHERLAAGAGTPRQQAAAQKEVDRLRKVVLELDEYEHDVLYPLATQQVQIDLDDGVKANYPKLGAALKKIPGLEASDE